MTPRTAGSAASSSTKRWIASFIRRTYLPRRLRRASGSPRHPGLSAVASHALERPPASLSSASPGGRHCTTGAGVIRSRDFRDDRQARGGPRPKATDEVRRTREAVPRALAFGTDVDEDRAVADGVADVRDGDAIEPA